MPLPAFDIPFRNDSGEEIPGFAILRITGVEKIEGQAVFTVEQANSEHLERLYYVNGPIPVPEGGYGNCSTLSQAGYVLYEPELNEEEEEEPPEHGKGWGPKPGEWSIHKGFYGFTILGNEDTDKKIVLARQVEVGRVLGQFQEDCDVDDVGDFNVFAGSKQGEEEFTGWTIEVYNRYRDPIPGSVWAAADWEGNGWEALKARC